MEKKSKKSIVIGITILLLVTLTLLGLTYAYYRTRIIGNQNEKSVSVTSKFLEITYTDGTSSVNMEGKIEPGYNFTKQFSVENTGDSVGKYSIKVDNVQSDFLREEDWSYELYEIGSDGTETLINKDVFPTYDFYLKGSISIDVNAVQSYKLVVKYAKLESVDQSEDMGASLSFRVTIDDETGTDVVEMTASELLATAVDGIITLNNHVILTDSLTIPADIKVIDLNDHILTVKGISEYEYIANPIKINNELEIKNGVITRYVSTDDNDYSLSGGSLLYVYGASANLTLTEMVLDGKNIAVNSLDGFGSNAIRAEKNSSLNIISSTLKNNSSNEEGDQSAGAIRAYGIETVVLENSKMLNNYSADGRSAMEAGLINTVQIVNSEIKNNISVGTSTVRVHNVNDFLFDETSIIKNNKAGEAGGLRLQDCTNAIVAGTIEGNVATKSDGNGGGLYTFSFKPTSALIIESTAKIINNIAGGAGGGVYVNSDKDSTNTTVGTVIMNGGLVSGNVAKGTPAVGTLKDGGGAGIYVSRGVMTINGGTIENNRSTSGIGDAILVSNAGGKANGGKLEITNGTILGSIEVAENYGTLTITGGTYSFDVTKYLGSGKTVTENNGKYVVS